MSSLYVVNQIKSYIQNEITNLNVVGPLIEIDGDIDDLNTFKSDNSLALADPWLGIQFEPSFETPTSVLATNTKGRYREDGVFLLHIVAFANSTATNDIRQRGDVLQNIFRGATINGDIIIESMSSPDFDDSQTISFRGGYIAASIEVDYYRNNTL